MQQQRTMAGRAVLSSAARLVRWLEGFAGRSAAAAPAVTGPVPTPPGWRHRSCGSCGCGAEASLGGLEAPTAQQPPGAAAWPAAAPQAPAYQADVLWVVGPISHKRAQALRALWDAMAGPRWCVAVGACAASGGLYRSGASVAGVAEILPVHVFVPGCPPTPAQVLDGLRLLGRQVGDAARLGA